MSAVNPSSPASATGADPAQALQLLELELARARARRLARDQDADGNRLVVRTVCVLFLLTLMAAGCYALWRAQELRGEARRVGPGSGASSSLPANRP